jgi:hypothetical protein
MAINTVYDDGALRVLGGLSAPSVGAGQAFGAGVQQRQEQRKSELGMDAQRLNMEATRQQMRLREEAAKRQAAAAQRQAAAAGRALEQAKKFRNLQQQSGPGVRPMFGGTATSPVPLSFGAAGAGLSGGGSMPYVIGSAGTDTLGTDARFPLGIAAPQDQPAGYGAGQVDPGLMRAAGLALPGAASPVQPSTPGGVQVADASGGFPAGSLPAAPQGQPVQADTLAPAEQPLFPQAPDQFVLTQIDTPNVIPGVGLINYVQYNPATGEIRGPNGQPVDPIMQDQMREGASFNYADSIENAAAVTQNRLAQARAAVDQAAATGNQATYTRALDEFRAVQETALAAQAALPNATAALRVTQPIATRGIFSEEGPGAAGLPPLVNEQATTEAAKGAPTSRLAKPETGTAGTTEETPPDVTAPVTDIQKGEIVDDPVAQVAADVVSRFEFPARFRLKTLNDPPALNGILTSTAAQRNQLYEQYTAYANAGFMEYANKFIPQIEALDKALDFLEANQALNDAIDYNDPRRLSQVLSQATDLGPVNVVAQRKGDEVVFTINTPGGQPIRPEYTEMSPDTLEKAVRMFVDADYRAQIAAGNAAREEAFSKALGKGQGENLAKAEQALSDAELRKRGIIPREVVKQVEEVDEDGRTALIITYTDGTAERVVPSTTDGITTYTRIQMQ